MRRTMRKTKPCRGGKPEGINLWPMQALMNLRTESQDRNHHSPADSRLASPWSYVTQFQFSQDRKGYAATSSTNIGSWLQSLHTAAIAVMGGFSISSHSPSNCIHSRHPPRYMHISRMIKKISQVTTIKHTGVQHSSTTSIRTTKQIV